MGEFWKYFKEILHWPLIQKPGPLAALLRGKANALDETRDDILYFRKQWFPDYCEDALVPFFGDARGLIRHPKETADQFRSRVIHAYTWHLLGGKVEGLPKILEFYGFEAPEIVNMRRLLPSRWANFQLAFRTPATQAEQEALLANLDSIIWLVNEYKPARSVLYRVYTGACNFEPQVWSWGYWGKGYWSNFSGTPYPDSDGKGEIIVSFGMVHRVQSDAFWSALRTLCWRQQDRAFRIFVNPRPLWSVTRWSEKIYSHKVFAVQALNPYHGCEYILGRADAWQDGAWIEAPWAPEARWDRRLSPFVIGVRGTPKSQGVYSDFRVDSHDWSNFKNKSWASEPWCHVRYHKTGQVRNAAGDLYPASAWSAPNCNWSWPVIVTRTFDDAVWSDTDWSQDTGEKTHIEIIEEQFYENWAALIKPKQYIPAWEGNCWPADVWWKEARHIDGGIAGFGCQTWGATLKRLLAPVWSESAWSGFYPLRYGGVINFAHSCLVAQSLRYGCEWEVKDWPNAIWEPGECLALSGGVWPQSCWQDKPWSKGPDNLRGIFETGQLAEFASLATQKPECWPIENWPGRQWDASLQNLDGNVLSCQEAAISNMAGPQDWTEPWPDKGWHMHPWRCEGHISGHDLKFFAGAENLGFAVRKPEARPGLPQALPGQCHAAISDGPKMRAIPPAIQSSFITQGEAEPNARGLLFQVETFAQTMPQANPGPGSYCLGTTHANLVDTDSNAASTPWPDIAWPQTPWAANLGIVAGDICFASEIGIAATGSHYLNPAWQSYEWDNAPWWYPPTRK